MKITIIPVTQFQQNCTLLWDETTLRGAVVDPGGDVPQILEAIAKQGVTIDKIALTHGHLDHAAGAAELKEALGGVPIEGPDERDRFLLDGLAEQCRAMGIAGGRPVTPDRWLQEGQTIELAGVEFAVLHCPGHTPGSVVFVDAAAKFAIVGDVLFRGSVGRTDFPYGNTEDLLASIRTKLLPLGDDVTFLCGHGPGSRIGVERVSNPFLR